MKCSRCQIDKPDGEFSPSSVARHKKGDYCRPCKREYYREKRREPGYMENARAQKRRQHARLLNDPVKLAAVRDRRRSTAMDRLYGLTRAEFDLMLAGQGGKCACCGSPDPGRNGRSDYAAFRIDHDHVTGAVRGLLCNTCNIGIGALGDTAEAIEKALIYLKQAADKGRIRLVSG